MEHHRITSNSSNTRKCKSQFHPTQPKQSSIPIQRPTSNTPIPAAVMDTDMLALAPSTISPTISWPGNASGHRNLFIPASSADPISIPSSSPISPEGGALSKQKPIYSCSPHSSSPYLIGTEPSSAPTLFPSVSISPSHSSRSRHFYAQYYSTFKNYPTTPTHAAIKHEQASVLMNANVQLKLPSTEPLPDAIQYLSPSFPAILFGGLSSDDEHVTVWEPRTGKTVAGNAAPYRRNLVTWLHAHPGWEEKADELKSSKRRSAARRSSAAANAFTAVCCYPAAVQLACDAAEYLRRVDYNNDDATSMSSWTADDFVRLQEVLVKMAQDVHKHAGDFTILDSKRWAAVATELNSSKLEPTVIYCSLYMLMCGISKSLSELDKLTSLPSGDELKLRSSGDISQIMKSISIRLPDELGTLERPPVIPPAPLLFLLSTDVEELSYNNTPYNGREQYNSFTSNDSVCSSKFGLSEFNHQPLTSNATIQNELSLGNKNVFIGMPAVPVGAAAVLERSFRAPREPRVTVWNPTNGRTISGNAAPCRRNLETWMKQHPGWIPKEEGQLSSSRRNRTRSKNRPTCVPNVSPSCSESIPINPSLKNASYSQVCKGTISGTTDSQTPKLAIPISPSSILKSMPRSVARPIGQCDMESKPESPHFHDALEGLLVLSGSSNARSIDSLRQLKRHLAVAKTEVKTETKTSSLHCSPKHLPTTNTNNIFNRGGFSKSLTAIASLDMNMSKAMSATLANVTTCSNDLSVGNCNVDEISNGVVEGDMLTSSVSNWSIEDDDEDVQSITGCGKGHSSTKSKRMKNEDEKGNNVDEVVKIEQMEF